MRVKMLASFEGPAISWPAGSEQDLSPAEAIRMIERGFAVPVAEVAVETAALEVVTEKRAKRKK